MLIYKLEVFNWSLVNSTIEIQNKCLYSYSVITMVSLPSFHLGGLL